MYYKSRLVNPDHSREIDIILEKLEIDIGEDLEKVQSELLQQIKDLGEFDLYEEIKNRMSI